MPQLTDKEQGLLDKLCRGRHGKNGPEACEEVNKLRRRKGVEEVSVSAVHRYLKCETHKRGEPERRGNKAVLSEKDIRILISTRKSLIRKASNRRRVTYENVIDAAWPRLDSEPLREGLSNSRTTLSQRMKFSKAKTLESPPLGRWDSLHLFDTFMKADSVTRWCK